MAVETPRQNVVPGRLPIFFKRLFSTSSWETMGAFRQICRLHHAEPLGFLAEFHVLNPSTSEAFLPITSLREGRACLLLELQRLLRLRSNRLLKSSNTAVEHEITGANVGQRPQIWIWYLGVVWRMLCASVSA